MTWTKKTSSGKRNAVDQQIQGRKATGARKLSMALSCKITSADSRMTLNTRGRKDEVGKTDGAVRIEGNNSLYKVVKSQNMFEFLVMLEDKCLCHDDARVGKA